MHRHSSRQVRAVLAVTVALALLTVPALLVLLRADPAGPVAAATVAAREPTVPWWALAVMFAVTEVFVLHVQVRREAQTISLSEIPLVLGLLFAGPGVVAVARMVGPAVVFAAQRRQAPLKIGYNVVQQTASGCAAGATYVLLLGPARFPDGRAVLALYAAVLVAALVDGLATRVVIGLYEGALRTRDLVREAVTYPPVSLMVATFGLVAAHALRSDERSALPLLACAAVVVLAYRAYTVLSGRHLSLERLYQFSQAIAVTPKVDNVLAEALGRAKDLLDADHAEALFVGADGELAGSVALDAGDRLRRSPEAADPLPAPLHEALVEHQVPVLLARGTRDDVHRAFLEARGWREAILTPLRGESGVTGVLTVADRLGDVRTFDRADVLLLETVANHTSIALQNGRLIDRLQHEALHDSLTSLPNRTLLQRRLAEALEPLQEAEADGRPHPGLAVMILDLDGFKEVNDTLGHQQGDRLLVEVAQRLRIAAGEGSLVSRLGGDEFAVLVDPCPDATYARGLGERLLHALEQPVRLEGLDVAVGASLGISLAPEHAADGAALLKRADVAMYTAKASTGGLNVYDAGQDTRAPRRLALASELRLALPRDELSVHVQPKCRLDTGAVVGVEALVRWQHPLHGLLGPDDFVPVAERSGLIRPLALRVLDEALAHAARWQRAGVDEWAAIGVAVNLSPRNLLDPDLVDDVARLLRRHGVAPGRLTLEITESSVMADPGRTIEVLQALRDLGVHLSVDDFGTGYSSLSYLKRLPVDEVKIDKSFVIAMDADEDDAAIVRSIVDLGSNLGLSVVAEGIESRDVFDQLSALGCTYGQGFHLGPPMPIGDFVSWLETPVSDTAA